MRCKKILFLNLTAFSKTGGIEKFNKALLKALSEFEQDKIVSSESYSLYDDQANEQYFFNNKYRGFSGKRIQFVISSFLKAKHFNQIILGHVNLAPIGCLIKIFYPKKNIVLITHGIEVWKPLKGLKKLIFSNADLILTVSNFTKDKLIQVQKINSTKIRLFYNTIDPYFIPPSTFISDSSLRKRYNLKEDDFVLFTLTRISSKEKYKGYDIVLKCLPQVVRKIPNVKYLIAGKYDEGEKERLDEIIKKLSLENVVLFAGYIKDQEVKDHFQMSDLFIMPSKGEGFGIVFIEAMACGLSVIAGNADGSVDALQNGKLGTLVNPLSVNEIAEAIYKNYVDRKNITAEQKYKLQKRTLDYFHFDQYKKRLEVILQEN